MDHTSSPSRITGATKAYRHATKQRNPARVTNQTEPVDKDEAQVFRCNRDPEEERLISARTVLSR